MHPPAAIAGLRDGNLGGRLEPTGYHLRCPLDVKRWPPGRMEDQPTRVRDALEHYAPLHGRFGVFIFQSLYYFTIIV